MAFDLDKTAKQLSQGVVAHPGKGRWELKHWESLMLRISLVNDNFMNYFLIPTFSSLSWFLGPQSE